MKKTLLVFFLFQSCLSFSQVTTEEPARHLFIGLAFSPDYCFRSLNNNDLSGSSNAVINERNEIETPRIGCTAGIVLGYRFKKPLMLETGVRYSLQGYQTKEISLTTLNGNGTFESAGSVRFTYNYNYIEIPLKASFLFGKKKIHFIAGGGLAAGIFLYERQLTERISPERKISKDSPNYIYNPFNLYVIASAGLDIQLGKRFSLNIQPNFKYGLLQIIDQPVSGHLWSAGLNAGLNFNL